MPGLSSSHSTREQIVAGQFTTAYDVVKTLRGSRLNTVRPESFRSPAAIMVAPTGWSGPPPA